MPVDRNLAASFAGNAWTALVQVAFIPVYVALLGVEAYGLIGFYGSVQFALALLDVGITPTLNREVGLARAGAREAKDTRDLLRSAELVLAGLGAALFAATWWLAPWIAARWLRVEQLEPGSVIMAIRLMGAVLAVRLATGAHRGAIAGAQAFVWLSGINAVFATLRGVGVIPVLWWSPTIEAFFAQQVAVTLVEAAFVRAKAWRLLPGRGPAAFSAKVIADVRRFRGGVALATAGSLVATQADKLAVSALFPLADFGHYALGSAVAGALALLAAPVGMVSYSRLVDRVGRGDQPGAVRTFRAASRQVAALVAPAALVLAAFAEPLLLLWTGDPAVSSKAAAPLAILSLGYMVNAALQLPFLHALAHGRSSAAAAFTWALCALYVPAVLWGLAHHGPLAAAWSWLGLNLVALVLVAALPLPDLERRARGRWLLLDLGAPALAAAAAVGAMAWAFAPP